MQHNWTNFKYVGLPLWHEETLLLMWVLSGLSWGSNNWWFLFCQTFSHEMRVRYKIKKKVWKITTNARRGQGFKKKKNGNHDDKSHEKTPNFNVCWVSSQKLSKHKVVLVLPVEFSTWQNVANSCGTTSSITKKKIIIRNKPIRFLDITNNKLLTKSRKQNSKTWMMVDWWAIPPSNNHIISKPKFEENPSAMSNLLETW